MILYDPQYGYDAEHLGSGRGIAAQPGGVISSNKNQPLGYEQIITDDIK